jgi:site-specific recombinase XerD
VNACGADLRPLVVGALLTGCRYQELATLRPAESRHAAGYMLANEGTDTRLIQDFLGHRDIRHTAHYTAISPKRLAAVRVR